HAAGPADAGAHAPAAAAPDAPGGGAGEAADEPAAVPEGLAAASDPSAVPAGEGAEAPPEIALDEEFDLEIGSLADLPDATHSLLFADEYTDPESAAIPLEAWAPLTTEETGEPGAAGDADAGPVASEPGTDGAGPAATEAVAPEGAVEEVGAPSA